MNILAERLSAYAAGLRYEAFPQRSSAQRTRVRPKWRRSATAFTFAIGTLKGPLHGGVNEVAMETLLEIGEPSKAAEWVWNALAKRTESRADSRANLRLEFA